MPEIPYKYVKKADLETKIRIPYTMDEMSNYCSDVNRKHLNFKTDVLNYRKSRNYPHAFPLQSLTRLLEAIKTSQSYIKNVINQPDNPEDFYL